MAKEEGKWLRLQDIKKWRTSDPKEMLDKYTSEQVRRTWTEDFIDEDTKEVVSIERGEIILGKGVMLGKNEIQTIMFHIQSGDIKDIEVTDMRMDTERAHTHRLAPFEVTCCFGINKKKYLVRARSIEQAIMVVGDFAPIYLLEQGMWSAREVKYIPVYVIDEDDIDQSSQAKPQERSYYRVTVCEAIWDELDGKDNKTYNDYIVAAEEIGEAKSRALEAAEAELDPDDFEKPVLSAVKAKPYAINGIVPLEYCQLYDTQEAKP